ncbi:glycoside hydrolase family 13 protein [Lonsdalea iberica]|uniref:Glucohydrolase n=1 Tax=Lonsdalea iberica TaxID=1082703 RepID=A0A1X3RUM0_9GAMM|nr:alpha-glucosidase [Lonsdalea iberica]OSN05628.1 glucohydrolase [Lonsdalea iberica]
MNKLRLASLIAISLGIGLCGNAPLVQAEPAKAASSQGAVIQRSDDYPVWWKQAVFYEVYLRSFKDGNGDGIGDFNGLIEKLDYLHNLGIDAIWITPHYDSPNQDSGYDIRDYRKVMADFGTMEDFDRLVAEMKKRNMRLMIDIVFNHTSDQHPWFLKSKESTHNPYRSYYFWREGKNGGVPNNYPSIFSGSAWEKEAKTDEYYLHYFSVHQPDLDWSNPQVRKELYDVMEFWMSKGVSGMRFDSINTISKWPDFPDLNQKQLEFAAATYGEGPNVHRYIQDMNEHVLSHHKDMAFAAETFAVPPEGMRNFVDQRRHEMDLAFMFEAVMFYRYPGQRWHYKGWTLPQLKEVVKHENESGGEYGWLAFFLGNHDNPRVVSTLGDDRPEWRELSAKALGTLLLTQHATPFIYQGDELGMINAPFNSIDDYHDIETKALYDSLVKSGKVKEDEFLKNYRITSREQSRTPMQWSAEKNAGFTTGTPWYTVNPTYKEINAASEVDNPHSVYNYYRDMIALRHRIPALVYGQYADLDPQNRDVFAYTRTMKGDRYLVVINFKEHPIDYTLPDHLAIGETLLESGEKAKPADNATVLNLQPWQTGIYKLK